VAALRASSATIDGEAVCRDESDLSVFEQLHSREHDNRALLYAFDLLELDGEDLRPQPLLARKARLEKLRLTWRCASKRVPAPRGSFFLT
jgi:bifunctional non-homologous end joining protein LigD